MPAEHRDARTEEEHDEDKKSGCLLPYVEERAALENDVPRDLQVIGHGNTMDFFAL